MKRYILLLFVLLLMITDNKVVSAQSYDDDNEKVNDYLTSELPKTKVQGMSIAITNKDKVVYQNIYGNVDSINTPFIIGSMSKSFTALAVLQLVEDGKVSLDDKVSTFIDEKCDEFPGCDTITIRQLLNQTSGITTYQTKSSLRVTDNLATFMYSNENYNLLGRIVENVTGISYEEYVKQNIFDVLHMNHSFTTIKEAKEHGLILGYQTFFGIPIVKELDEHIDQIPSGYLISSAADLANYLQMFLSEGYVHGSSMITEESIHKMMFEGVTASHNSATEDMFGSDSAIYGMGWINKLIDNNLIIYHSGKVENFVSIMVLLPEKDLGIVMLFNLQDMLVSQSMIEKLQEGVISILIGDQPELLGQYDYMKGHCLLDAIYLLLLLSVLIPVFRIKKWYKKALSTKKYVLYIKIILLHFIWSSFLLVVIPIMGMPYSLVLAYAPDLFWVLLGSSIISYSCGVVKLVLQFKKRVVCKQ